VTAVTTRSPLSSSVPVRGLLVLLCCLPALSAVAQKGNEINRIVFDPQPLSAAQTQAQAPTAVASTAAGPAVAPRSTSRPRPISDAILPTSLLPQTVEAGIAADTAERYLEAIAAEELDNGPFAPELLQQFMALAETYQQQGQHEEALEAFGKAEYISRINNGLYAPEQFGIVENMIESHLAAGDLVAANSRQQYLLFLQQQVYGEDSMEVVPALAELGDWNMSAFNTILNRATPFTLSMNFNSRINEPPPRAVAFGNLYMAQSNYYRAILNLVKHSETDSPELLELETKLIEAIFLGANRNGILDDPDFYMDRRHTRTGSRIARSNLNGASLSFINGRNAWLRMRIYQEHNPAAQPLDIAETLIGLGDWHMLFNRRLTALDYYREALAYLQQQEVPAPVIDSLLSPPVPQQLPVFTPLPHSRAKFGIAADAPLDYSGYLDVSFRITRYGNVRDMEVLGKTDNASPALERRLKRLLRSAPFRPRIIDGEPADSDTVALRYYFAMAQ
jgi:tetratricopeptide (TPR) repeat protein